MADSTKSRDERKDEPERRGAPVGGSPAVADDGDVAFGGMVGTAIVTAVIISMLALGGFFNDGSSDSAKSDKTEETVVDDENEADHDGGDEEAEPEPTTTTEAPTTTEAAEEEPEPEPEEAAWVEGNLMDVADKSGQLDTLVGIVGASGAGAVLEAPGPFTVFAPSDEAIANIPEGIADDPAILQRVLAYHVVAGNVGSADLVEGAVTTLDGSDININLSGAAPTINGVNVVETDLTANNGVIHIIDRVLIPPDLQAQLGGSLNEALGLAPINFEVNSAVITADSTAVLDGAAEFLIANNTVVEIAGHTDSDGDPAFNLQLSQDRADAVMAYLTDQGVPAENMTAVGYGEDQPVAENDTPENKAKNRRIEFVSAGS